MVRTIVTAVLVTALLAATCFAAKWYTGFDTAVVAAVLLALLVALVLRRVRHQSARPGRMRIKSATQPRWLPLVVALVATIAPTVGWGMMGVGRWVRDQVVDADRSHIEATWHKLREEGNWEGAVTLLQQRLARPVSSRWRLTLVDALHEAVLNRASRAEANQAQELLTRANDLAEQQRVRPDLATALTDRLEQRAQRQALEGQLSQLRQLQTQRDQLHDGQLRDLQIDVAGRQRESANAEVALRLRLGDALGTRFEQRRTEYMQARAVAVHHGLDTLPADQALATLDRQIADLQPITLDPQIHVRPIRSQFGDTSPVRIVDFAIDAPPGAKVPALQIKDLAAFQHNQGTPVLAMERLDRSQQRPQLAILLDTSRSMRGGRMEEAKRETSQLIEDLSPSVDIGVYAVHDTVLRVADWNTNPRAASQVVTALQAQGGTALLRAVEIAVNELARRPQPRAIVLLTDGKDSVGGRPAAELIQMARDQGVTIHAVGFKTEETDFPLLQELAEATSGSMQAVEGVGRLAMHFADVAAAVRRPVYRVVFPVGADDADLMLRIGTNHTLRLEPSQTARAARRP